MKPLAHSNMSAFGYIGLLLLFYLPAQFGYPVVGYIAMIICAFFVRNPSVKKFARIMLIIELVLLVVVIVIVFVFGEDLLDGYYEFPMNRKEELEAMARALVSA